jgi:uncharacterized membrane protein YhaH (DUF805 family)
MVSSLALLFFQEEIPQEIPAGAAAGMGVFAFVYIAVIILLIAAMWKVFTKAGKPGWAAIVPIYNFIVLLEIAGKPVWWIVLFLIPFVNFIILIIVAIAVAKNFGKGTGFGLGLAFLSPIFYPILAWGDAQYNPQP